MFDRSLLPDGQSTAIATLRTDPFRHQYGKRIQNEDAVLASRGQGKGLWLYDELARDPVVGMALDKRRKAVVSREWALEPGEKNKAGRDAMEHAQRALKALPFDQVAEDLLQATLRGIAISEVMWKVDDELGIVPSAIVARDPRRFTFRDTDGGEPELRLLTRDRPDEGIALPERKFIVHTFGQAYGSPWGRGLGQVLFWPVFFKQRGIAFWATAIEKFAAPSVLGRYPAGTSEEAREDLLKALAAISRDAAVTIPEGMSVELIEAKRAGTFETYEQFARYMDKEILITVLGETLTSTAQGAGGGGGALGEVHNEVRLAIAKADADMLSGTLNTTLLRWIAEVNFGPVRPPRIWWEFRKPKDLEKMATVDKCLFELGWVSTPQRIEEIYGQGFVRRS